MAVVTDLLNSTKAAELIRERTGRACSRQRLEELCRAGRLPRSCVSLKPIRLDPIRLVGEYESVLPPPSPDAPANPAAPAPSILDQPPERVPPRRPDAAMPEYNESRARSEYEKANLLELERKTKEGLLLRREDVETAWAAAVNITRSKLLGVPSAAKQRIQHLELEEVELLTALIREALDELSSDEVRE
jgi:hypothetical protein